MLSPADNRRQKIVRSRTIRGKSTSAALRSQRGLGKPETFTFLGFAFVCGKQLGPIELLNVMGFFHDRRSESTLRCSCRVQIESEIAIALAIVQPVQRIASPGCSVQTKAVICWTRSAGKSLGSDGFHRSAPVRIQRTVAASATARNGACSPLRLGRRQRDNPRSPNVPLPPIAIVKDRFQRSMFVSHLPDARCLRIGSPRVTFRRRLPAAILSTTDWTR